MVWDDTTPLDRSSFVPLYAQIHERISSRIKDGRLKVGDLLPPENELATAYQVSRMTCRQALQLLSSQGYLVRTRGAGSSVTLPKVDKDVSHLHGFTAEIRAMGGVPSSKVLKNEIIGAPQEAAKALCCQVGEPVFLLERLRFAGEQAMALEQAFLPLRRMIGIEKLDFSGTRSLYETLTEIFGIRVNSADETIEARLASKHESQYLSYTGAALVMNRTLYDVEGRPIEFAKSVYRGDRYRATMKIRI